MVSFMSCHNRKYAYSNFFKKKLCFWFRLGGVASFCQIKQTKNFICLLGPDPDPMILISFPGWMTYHSKAPANQRRNQRKEQHKWHPISAIFFQLLRFYLGAKYENITRNLTLEFLQWACCCLDSGNFISFYD